MSVVTGEGVRAYQCLVLAAGIKLWRQHKIKANRDFQIKKVLATAASLTNRGPYRVTVEEMLAAETDLAKRAKFIKENLIDG